MALMDDPGIENPSVHGSQRFLGQAEFSREEAALRAAVVAVARDLDRLKLNQGSSGNVSARLRDGMIITPSAVPADRLQPESLFLVSLDARARARRPDGSASSEWRLHRDILRARPEVGAVVHCHSVYATALAILNDPLPAAHYMVALMGGEVRCAPYAPFGSQALSDAAVEALEGRHAALLGNHGAVAVGANLEEAMDRARELEILAQTYIIARSVGAPAILSPAQVAEAVAQFSEYRPSRTGPSTT